MYMVFQKELCNGVPNVTVWQVSRKRLHSPQSNIWNTIVKLPLKHPALPVKVTLNRNSPK
jgi:hypothetical protein